MTCEYIQVTYGWHTSTYEWHTDENYWIKLMTFTEEIVNGKFYFLYSVNYAIYIGSGWPY